MENGILVELKFIDIMNEESDQFPQRPKSAITKWTPNNVAEYFFFDEYGFLSINEKKIKDCYQEFTEVLNLIHSNVKVIYNQFAQHCLSTEDISRGVEFPETIDSTIFMKGLEHFFQAEKKAAIKQDFQQSQA